MPCTYEESPEEIAERQKNYVNKQVNEIMQKFVIKEKATKDKLARMACVACGLLDEQGIEIEDPELKAWWKTHKEHDKTRVQQDLDEALIKYNKANTLRIEAEKRLHAIQKEAEKIRKRKK